MIDNYDKYSDILHEQFLEPFEELYKQSSKKTRAKLLLHANNIYRRWHYATLLESTPFTPANIIELLNHEYAKGADFSPSIALRTPKKYTGITLNYKKYSYHSHPVADDLRAILLACKPTIDFNNIDVLPNETLAKLSKLVHMHDSFYVLFLIGLILELELLVKVPSLHTVSYQPAKAAADFIALSDKQIFDKVLETTLKIATYSLNDYLPIEIQRFSENDLLNMLKKAANIEELFASLLNFFDIGFEDIPNIQDLGNDMANFTEKDMMNFAILSSTHFFGSMLDKFLLTPLGYYLKVIRPFYIIPFSFENEVFALFNDIDYELYQEDMDDRDIEVLFYAPCSFFYLTQLGLDCLKLAPSPEIFLTIGDERFNFAHVAPFFEHSLFSEIKEARAMVAKEFEPDICVYSLRVKHGNNHNIWLNIDVSDTTNLHRLYLELTNFFDIDRNAKYAFSLTEQESPFTAYSSPNQPKMPINAEKTPLGDLELDTEQTIFLYIQERLPTKKIIRHKWLLEVRDIHSGKLGISYPNVTRLCKALQVQTP
ncbi:MAG: hypothetical protein FWG68_05555 [Defluviitaleaceae bacterium]|nr:hypothetical protein [Defluviitaleaceae bacterium]